MTKAALKSSPQRNASQQATIFTVLMYFLYGLPINLNFKQKYQQCGPCFQTIFPLWLGNDVGSGEKTEKWNQEVILTIKQIAESKNIVYLWRWITCFFL